MAQRIGSRRRKTRDKLAQPTGKKGKVSIRRAMGLFNAGDSVVLNANPAIHKRMYHPRFHGVQGKILARRGKCYEVEINDKGKKKTILVNPTHLKSPINPKR